MSFFYSLETTRKSRWTNITVGSLMLVLGVIQLYRIATSSLDLFELFLGALFLFLGNYNIYIGAGTFTNNHRGRAYIKVDSHGIFKKEEWKKRAVFLWCDIDAIRIRRTGLYLVQHGKEHKMSYDDWPYHIVRELQSAIKKISKQNNVAIAIDEEELS